MVNREEILYPDILGFLAQAPGQAIGPVEVAIGLRPRIVRSGRNFDVILLVQNTIDAPVELKVSVIVPDKDALGLKGRFLHRGERLAVQLQPAEVGFMQIPVSTALDTTPAESYSIAAEVDAKPLGKGVRVRSPGEGGSFKIKSMAEAKQKLMNELLNLRFSNRKRGLFRGNSVETDLSIISGKNKDEAERKPGWHSLWTLGEHHDMELLLSKYGELVRVRFMPSMNRKKFFKPTLARVGEVFTAAGYPLRPIEARAVAKLLTLILEYSSNANTQVMMEAGRFSVEPFLLGENHLSIDEVDLPRWFDKIMRSVARDERVAGLPQKAVLGLAFDELLFDAMMHSFEQIERATGEDLGTHEEMETYAQSMVEAIKTPGQVDFSVLYMPLMIGAILMIDRVLLPDMRLSDELEEIRHLLEERAAERNEANDMIFEIAQRVINQTLRKYGSLDNRI